MLVYNSVNNYRLVFILVHDIPGERQSEKGWLFVLETIRYQLFQMLRG